MFLHSGISQLSLNPSISIRVYKTVVILKALYGSELWSSMTPADFGKLEHSHRFCLKHMQGLPRRTPTNITLSAINVVPMETVIDKKTELFDNCVTFHAHIYMAKRVFNIRLTHFQHLDNQSLGFIPDINRILTKQNDYFGLLLAISPCLSPLTRDMLMWVFPSLVIGLDRFIRHVSLFIKVWLI